MIGSFKLDVRSGPLRERGGGGGKERGRRVKAEEKKLLI